MASLPRTTLSTHGLLAVTTGPDGTFYASDAAQHISRYDAAGRLLDRWGSRGGGPGQLRMVSGSMAVGLHGRVYVADTGNARVDVFTAGGRFVTSYGSFGPRVGDFRWPTDVAIDARGGVYVADQRSSTITRLTAQGAPVWRLGRRDSTLLDDPVHLGLSTRDGSIIAVDEVTGEVFEVRASGRLVVTDPAAPRPAGSRFCEVSEASSGVVMVATCPAKGATPVVYVDRDASGHWTRVALAAVPRFLTGDTGWAVTAGLVVRVRSGES